MEGTRREPEVNRGMTPGHGPIPGAMPKSVHRTRHSRDAGKATRKLEWIAVGWLRAHGSRAVAAGPWPDSTTRCPSGLQRRAANAAGAPAAEAPGGFLHG